jgi:DNA-binding cell septation regulator SpoVG
MKERSTMQINVTSIGPSQGQRKPSVLAVASAEITLFNGDQIDKIVISDLQVIKDADADILWVAFPGQRKSDGRWAKIVSTSTRLRRKIEDAVLEAYDRWCNAGPANCAEANSGNTSAPASILGGAQ